MHTISVSFLRNVMGYLHLRYRKYNIDLLVVKIYTKIVYVYVIRSLFYEYFRTFRAEGRF